MEIFSNQLSVEEEYNNIKKLLPTYGDKLNNSYINLKNQNLLNYQLTNPDSIGNIVNAINENLKELNLIQNQMNAVNNLNQEALLKKDQLLRMENDELMKQLRELEKIQSTISNKSRLIEESNKNTLRHQRNINFLYVSILFAAALFINIIFYGFSFINSNNFTLFLILIISFYLIYAIYYYNFLYVNTSTKQLFDKSGPRLMKNIKELDDYIEQEITDTIYGNKKEWLEDNCACEDESKDSSIEVLDGGNMVSALEKPGNFYYDGSAPQQILPNENNITLKDQINWVDYSGDGNVKYIPEENLTLYDNSNYYNAKNKDKDPSLLENRYNPNELVNNSTLTSNN